MNNEPDRVIIFDGECNLCEYSVQFIIKHDRKGTFRFAAAQSDRGKELQLHYGVDTIRDGTVILVKSGKSYIRSDAAVEIAAELDPPWNSLRVLRFLPRLIREPLYAIVSKNRYKWFGKRATCLMPDSNLQDRFL